jgi:RimJ/RimL family protein N-acetyltransferase
MIASARVANPAARNVLEKCGFQRGGVELHRYDALGSSTPVDCFRLSRSVWASLRSWSTTIRRDQI